MVLGNIAHVVYQQNQDKDTFTESAEKTYSMSFAGLLWQIINLAIFVFAIYLSFQRNSGFDLGSFLAACCCSVCYVVYALAVPVSQF